MDDEAIGAAVTAHFEAALAAGGPAQSRLEDIMRKEAAWCVQRKAELAREIDRLKQEIAALEGRHARASAYLGTGK